MTQVDHEAIAATMAQVADAACPFESRWKLSTLRRIDPDLHENLVEQQALYHQALVTADRRELAMQSAAMIRGWIVATTTLERSGEPDDAYLLGIDGKTGLRVAIGTNAHAIGRVRELHGELVVWLTPDEVAVLVAGTKGVSEVKQAWPDAEVVRMGQLAADDQEVAA